MEEGYLTAQKYKAGHLLRNRNGGEVVQIDSVGQTRLLAIREDGSSVILEEKDLKIYWRNITLRPDNNSNILKFKIFYNKQFE